MEIKEVISSERCNFTFCKETVTKEIWIVKSIRYAGFCDKHYEERIKELKND